MNRRVASPIPPSPRADQIPAPDSLDAEVAKRCQGERQQEQSDNQRLAQSVRPRRQGPNPLTEGLQAEIGRRNEITVPVAEDKLTDTERDEVERNDRQRVGIQRGNQRHGQIDPKDQATNGGSKHLQRTRDQSAEKPNTNGTGRRVAIEMPQTRMQQSIGKGCQPAITTDGLVIGQETMEMFAHVDELKIK